jgi:hypothetical protein
LAEHHGPDALEIVPESLTSEVAGTLIADLNTRTLGLVRLVLETGTRQAEALALYRPRRIHRDLSVRRVCGLVCDERLLVESAVSP